ncbi:unnamed protein product [Hermetia illucens]|uniref:Guided entry of tail-anchored proteins factor 1 n=1 Tax=Hermetia illucens TaxID=343691 RepID=A0A7R8YZG6_HERIL|nr:Golgi to ER traffic protein 1 [Hermetia illucens]CAD7089972.1 unnamed protein product [Hermetia illucens]
MFLLVLITVLCSIVAFSNVIAKPIQAFLKRPSTEELQILKEIDTIKKQLSKISVRDQYTEYVKTERKIITLEKNLSTLRNKKFANNLFVDYGVKYGLKAIVSFVLLIISIFYRYEPVIVFEKRFNFAPFGFLMNFPTGIEGAVSVPFWIFVSSFTLRSITDYLKI